MAEDSTDQALEMLRQEIARRGLPLPPLPALMAETARVEGQAGVPELQQPTLFERPELTHLRIVRHQHRLWLRWALAILGLLATLPWLAPIFAAADWWDLANPIYTLYMFLCHQLPERAATLFGYQVAFCWRNSAIYGGLFGFGLLYALSTRPGGAQAHAGPYSPFAKLPRTISLRLYVLALVPMAVDGFSHMLGLRDSLLVDPAFGSVFAGSQFLSFNWWLRILTGLLAALGTVWYVFPRLDKAMATGGAGTGAGTALHPARNTHPSVAAGKHRLSPTAFVHLPSLSCRTRPLIQSGESYE